MSWNYRIMRHRNKLPKHMAKKLKEHHPKGYVEWFGIHEVYYKKSGKPYLCSTEPLGVTTDTYNKSEFNRVLKWMRMAVKKPVLDFKTLKEVKDVKK